MRDVTLCVIPEAPWQPSLVPRGTVREGCCSVSDIPAGNERKNRRTGLLQGAPGAVWFGCHGAQAPSSRRYDPNQACERRHRSSSALDEHHAVGNGHDRYNLRTRSPSLDDYYSELNQRSSDDRSRNCRARYLSTKQWFYDVDFIYKSMRQCWAHSGSTARAQEILTASTMPRRFHDENEEQRSLRDCYGVIKSISPIPYGRFARFIECQRDVRVWRHR